MIFNPLMYKNRQHSTEAGYRLFCCPILLGRCRFCSFLKLLSYRHTAKLMLFSLQNGMFWRQDFPSTTSTAWFRRPASLSATAPTSYMSMRSAKTIRPLGKLMHDFSCTQADDMHYPVLAERVRYFKENVKGVTTMCREIEKLVIAERNEGRLGQYRAIRQEVSDRIFCPNSKFGKRRNPVCISRFSNWRSGAKRRRRLADAIVRCCLRYSSVFNNAKRACWMRFLPPIQTSGKWIQMFNLPFSYFADIVPFICSISFLEIDNPRPVDFLAFSTV